MWASNRHWTSPRRTRCWTRANWRSAPSPAESSPVRFTARRLGRSRSRLRPRELPGVGQSQAGRHALPRRILRHWRYQRGVRGRGRGDRRRLCSDQLGLHDADAHRLSHPDGWLTGPGPTLCSWSRRGDFEWIASAITEPNAGSDAASLTTFAVKSGDKYLLSGSKTFITTGDRADVIVCSATVDRSRGRDGITALVVDGRRPGLSRGKPLEKLGMHGRERPSCSSTESRCPLRTGWAKKAAAGRS